MFPPSHHLYCRSVTPVHFILRAEEPNAAETLMIARNPISDDFAAVRAAARKRREHSQPRGALAAPVWRCPLPLVRVMSDTFILADPGGEYDRAPVTFLCDISD